MYESNVVTDFIATPGLATLNRKHDILNLAKSGLSL